MRSVHHAYVLGHHNTSSQDKQKVLGPNTVAYLNVDFAVSGWQGLHSIPKHLPCVHV